MKIKKNILRLGAITSIAVPIVAVVSCGQSLDSSKPFSVGFATDPITSLNYLKYKSTLSFAHSLVESISKTGPLKDTSLKNAMNSLPNIVWDHGQGGNQPITSQYNVYSGTLRVADSDATHDNVAFSTFDNKAVWGGATKIVDMNLNGESTWANGDKLTSSNYIDFVAYVLDLNTGSQFYKDIVNMDIENSAEFVDAQTEYAKIFGNLYQNPFGYEKTREFIDGNMSPTTTAYRQMAGEFPLQYTGNDDALKARERELVDKIEYAAKNLGVFGDDQSSHPFSRRTDGDFIREASAAYNSIVNARGVDKISQRLDMNSDSENYVVTDARGHDSYPYRLRLTTNLQKSSFEFLINGITRSYLMPVNRKFVEQVGGVEKFGLSSNAFLTEGPFKIKELTLGDRGGALFEKDQNYWDAENTIPDTIRIYFQTDPLIKSSLLKDGYISYTALNAMATKDLYSDENYRRLISKRGGFGTTGLVFNLDPNSEGYNEDLSNPNLRKAIFYAVDREEIIKLSGFDATLPAYAMTDSNYEMSYDWLATNKGINFSTVFSDQSFHSSIPDSEGGAETDLFPLSSQSYSANGMLIGNVDKTDRAKNIELARKYFEKFKQETGKSSVDIQFTHDSTNSLLNTGIALQTQLRTAFGGSVNLQLKGYPKSIYDSFISQGKFGITYKVMDYLASSGGFYVDAFFVKDNISEEERKTMGFVSNPTGGWTFNDVIEKFSSSNVDGETEAQFMSRLGIDQVQWDLIKELSTPPTEGTPEENLTLHRRKVNAFFSKVPYEDGNGVNHPVDENFDSAEEVGEVALALNKIIMDQSPVIPLFIVDILISVSRMAGYSIVNGANMYSFDYAYDLFRRPRPGLPGPEAIGE